MSTLRQPAALIPIAMSSAALAIVLVHLTFFGAARQADEGAEAHIWQLLMVGQIPVIAFFVLTRLTRDPASALRILGVQAAAALAAMAPVYLLGW